MRQDTFSVTIILPILFLRAHPKKYCIAVTKVVEDITLDSGPVWLFNWP